MFCPYINKTPKRGEFFARIMIKINKGYSLKITSLISAGIFLLNNAVYGVGLSYKTHLRVPISSSTLRRVDDVLSKGQAVSHDIPPKPSVKTPLHIYREASEEEKIKILDELNASRTENISLYLNLFNKGMEKSDRILELRLKDIVGDRNGQLTANRIFHEGLIKDEDGVYWIVKKFNPNAKSWLIEDRDVKNFPHHEMLAYLIARDIANMAEIRFPKKDETRSLSNFTGDIGDYYLTRVITSSNININELPSYKRGKAFAGIFVANILMRKFDQHLGNFGYTHNIPVAIDNDEVFDYNKIPHNKDGLQKFTKNFLFNIFSPIMIGYLEYNKTLLRDFLDIAKVNSDIAVTIYFKNMMEDFGLGAGFVASEMLRPGDIREAIIKFKKIDNIRELVIQAGYPEEEIDKTVEYIVSCQKSLGSDIDMIWEILTGKNCNFAELDSAIFMQGISPALSQSI